MRAIRTTCLVLVVILTTASPAVAADPWDPIWERSVKEDTGSWVVPPLTSVATDPGGNAYVTGYRVYGDAGVPDGGSSITLGKYAPDGDLVWRRVWSHPSGYHRFAIGFDVAVAPEGRTVYVAGARFNDSSEDAVPMVWAYSSGGRLRWAHAAWGGRYSAMARAVVARPGGVVVGGFTFGECGPTNGVIAAWSAAGERRWQDRFEPAARDAYGDALNDLAVGPGGAIYAVGSQDLGATSCDLTEPTPDVDVMIQRRAPDGRIAWTRVWGDGDVVDFDGALAVALRGDVIAVGGRRDGLPGRAWLARISSTGAVRWSRTFPQPPAGGQLTGLSVASWGSIYAVGKATGAMFLRRYAQAGDLISARRLAGPEASDVATAWGGAVYVTGRATLWRMPR